MKANRNDTRRATTWGTTVRSPRRRPRPNIVGLVCSVGDRGPTTPPLPVEISINCVFNPFSRNATFSATIFFFLHNLSAICSENKRKHDKTVVVKYFIYFFFRFRVEQCVTTYNCLRRSTEPNALSQYLRLSGPLWITTIIIRTFIINVRFGPKFCYIPYSLIAVSRVDSTSGWLTSGDSKTLPNRWVADGDRVWLVAPEYPTSRKILPWNEIADFPTFRCPSPIFIISGSDFCRILKMETKTCSYTICQTHHPIFTPSTKVLSFYDWVYTFFHCRSFKLTLNDN